MNQTITASTKARSVGQVKWFNNKAGYGFITLIDRDKDSDKAGIDIFVHHTAIQVQQAQYKYLVQGEYVEFELVAADNNGHAWQAISVSGVNSGKLMCETRALSNRDNIGTNSNTPYTRPQPQQQQQPRQMLAPQQSRYRGGGPRVEAARSVFRETDEEEWMLVRRKKPEPNPLQHSQRQPYVRSGSVINTPQ